MFVDLISRVLLICSALPISSSNNNKKQKKQKEQVSLAVVIKESAQGLKINQPVDCGHSLAEGGRV